jgi:septal ring factor EnvC (AmiA/AmiB activator)
MYAHYRKLKRMVQTADTPKQSYGRGPGRPGIAEIDVVRAAESLLREGKRPTVAAVRERTGGSNATIAPLLDAWWRSFSSRIAHGPAAFERIPSPLAHVAEALWLQTLSEARARVLKETSSAHHQTEREKADLEVRSHVLSLREAELQERLHKREREHAELEAQVRTLSVALRKEQANAASGERRMATLQAELDSLRIKVAARASRTRRIARKRTSGRRTRSPKKPSRKQKG